VQRNLCGNWQAHTAVTDRRSAENLRRDLSLVGVA
jgi:hypothetical protein